MSLIRWLWMPVCLWALTGCYTQLRPPSSIDRLPPDESSGYQAPANMWQEPLDVRGIGPPYRPYRLRDCPFYDPYDSRWINQVRTQILCDPFWFDSPGYADPVVVLYPRWRYPGGIYLPPVYVWLPIPPLSQPGRGPEVIPEVSKHTRVRRVGFGAEVTGPAGSSSSSGRSSAQVKPKSRPPEPSPSKKESPKPEKKKDGDNSEKEKRQEKRKKGRRRGGMS